MSARERILDGAAEVMRTRGLANSTTKEIARAAGLSEAMLYKVFRDKVDLFLGVLTERLPRIALVSDGYAEHVGRDTVQASLRRLAAEMLTWYLETFPMAAGLFADPGLLVRHREELRERSSGPHLLVDAVAAYLAAEQQGGRVAPAVRPGVMAELLVGACLHRAFLVRFAGETVTPEEIERFAVEVADALGPALNPP